jgi:GTP-binding protein
VSERAGWTDQICFYQLGKMPPVLIMADLPGYGHAVCGNGMQKQWKAMTRDYLGSRLSLCRCCVLVDCTRGLCDGDFSILKFLSEENIPWQIILTKCDLLTQEDLLKSIIIIENDLKEKKGIVSYNLKISFE